MQATDSAADEAAGRATLGVCPTVFAGAPPPPTGGAHFDGGPTGLDAPPIEHGWLAPRLRSSAGSIGSSSSPNAFVFACGNDVPIP
ncbi:UNVERIFIED_CONTAM: hypothetical protein Sindi_2534800, partial [Sesamum indicum]